jgi:hypothetical protein
VEQGVTATDSVDGNITGKVVVTSNVIAVKSGNYTVTYNVTNTAGLSSSVTRRVEIVAPESRIVPGRTYSFSLKGKQGETLSNGFNVDVAGNVVISVSDLSKTTVSITILDPAGREVFKESFTANATRNFKAATGNYSVRTSIAAANGNTSFGLNITTPGGAALVFPKPEITR